MKFGSVCSGIEAASVAWSPLGWEAAWFAEIEPFPSAVLAHHYPHVPNLGDMTTIARRVLSGEVEAPDLLCGGTPCQAFSVAGLRKSLDDDRGNLTLKFVELADAIDHVRVRAGLAPADIFWENVPGVLSTKDNAFGCFLAGLAGEDEPLVSPRPPDAQGRRTWSNAGCVYGPKRAIAWRTLDAQYFGLAQRRRRVFVVASAGNEFDPATVLFEWDGVRRDTPPSRQAGQESAGTLASRTDGGGFPGTDEACSGYVQPVTPTLDASFGRLQGCSGQDANHGHGHLVTAFGGNRTSGSIDISPALLAQPGSGYKGDFESETFLVQETAHTLRGEGFDASEDGTGRGTPLVPVSRPVHAADVSPCLRAGNQFNNSDPGMEAQMLVAFDTTQVTSATNRSNPQPGDACHPLAAGEHPPAITYAVRTANTSANGHGVSPELAHTLDQAQGQAIAFHGSQDPDVSGDVTHPVGRNQGQETCAQIGMHVRRLTPVECERLQGFPDGYTAIPWRNKPASECPDGPRYKALGNSWATNVVNWLGRRLAKAKGLEVAA